MVTNGGLLGTITEVGESFVTVELAENVQIKVQKHAISSCHAQRHSQVRLRRTSNNTNNTFRG